VTTTLETTPIKRITPTGVELIDDRSIPLDILVCATGFDTSYQYPFPIKGKGGVLLNDRWSPNAEAYLSIAVDGFPNAFWTLGPSSAVGSGSLLILIEREVEYAVAATLKLQRERLAALEVKRAAVRAWRAYAESYFPRTVFAEMCQSWYRGKDGTIVALWPGSCLHAVRTLAHPRWEDYEYTPLDEGKNMLYWLGDGRTYNEKTMTGDRKSLLRTTVSTGWRGLTMACRCMVSK